MSKVREKIKWLQHELQYLWNTTSMHFSVGRSTKKGKALPHASFSGHMIDEANADVIGHEMRQLIKSIHGEHSCRLNRKSCNIFFFFARVKVSFGVKFSLAG